MTFCPIVRSLNRSGPDGADLVSGRVLGTGASPLGNGAGFISGNVRVIGASSAGTGSLLLSSFRSSRCCITDCSRSVSHRWCQITRLPTIANPMVSSRIPMNDGRLMQIRYSRKIASIEKHRWLLSDGEMKNGYP